MVDYNELLEPKLRRRVLFDKIEDMENKIKYCVGHDYSEHAVAILEDVYTSLDEIIKKYDISEPVDEA